VSRLRKVGEDVVGEALVETFRRGGFAGASLRELQTATGLGPASLYHRFGGGKQAMAGAALDHVGGSFGTLVIAPLAASGDVAARLSASADGVRRFYDDGRLACLLAIFTLSDAPEPVRAAVAAAFTAWRDALAAALADAGVASPDAVAEDRVATIQGALVLARATGERGAFDRAVAQLAAVR
jgi:AcrR family transcriptional regulator